MDLHPTDMLPPGTTWILSYGKTKPATSIGVVAREDFDAAVARLQNNGHTVWMARAGFASDKRKKANVVGVRSLSIDVDLDATGEKNGRPCYRSHGDAIAAVLGLVKNHSVPAPSTVVDSGGGLHLWWRLDDVMQADEWSMLAGRWKNWIKSLDPLLAVDTKRWADCNGLLRPWPSINSKYDPPRRVRSIAQTGRSYSELALSQAIPARHTAVTRPTRATGTSAAARSRVDSGDSTPISAVPVEDFVACGVIRQHIDRRAAVASEPEWYTMLTAAAFLPTAVRAKVAHAISAPHPGYDPDETDAKFARVLASVEEDGVGPPSCGTLRETVMGDAEDRSRCAGCPLAAVATHSNVNFVKAAKERHIQGRKRAAAEKVEDRVAGTVPGITDFMRTADDVAALLEDVSLPSYLGDGPAAGEPFYLGEGPDGTVSLYGKHAKGADILFSPTWWVERHFGPKSVVIVQDPRTLAYTRHILPRDSLGSNQSLYPKLASFGIANAANRGERHITEAINRYTNTVQLYAPSRDISMHCGLSANEDFFALGDVAIMADGSLGRSVPGSTHAGELFGAIRFKGTLEGGLVALHTAVQAATDEARFVIGAAMASPLLAMGPMSGGVVAVVGPGDAGKTLALIAAAQVWGTHSEFMTSGSDTYNSVMARAGALHNLPLLMDEATLMQPQHLSDLVYAATVGRPKRANNNDGSSRKLPPPWKLTTFLTMNRSLRGIIDATESSDDAAAAKQSRIIEIHTPSDIFPGARDRTELGRMLTEHSGLVGLEVVRHVMRNRERIAEKLRITARAVEEGSEIARFAAHTIASYVVLTDELRELGWWPTDRETDMAIVGRITRQVSADMQRAVSQRNSGLVPSFLAALARHTMSVEVDGNGVYSAPVGDHNLPSVQVRKEKHPKFIVTYVGAAFAAGILRAQLSKGVDKAHQRGAVTQSEIEYYLGVLRKSGMEFERPAGLVRMGAGMGTRLASASGKLHCICWVEPRDEDEMPLFSSRPKLAAVDGRSVN